MAKADYYKGLTIEGDELTPRMTIDGRLLEGVTRDDAGLLFIAERPEVRTKTLYALGKQVVDSSKQLSEEREAIRDNHLRILKKGVEYWNAWRRENPATRPLLFEANLRKESLGLPNLNFADFANANLIRAELSEMDLIGANFHEANLGGADLSHANLADANFWRTDLYMTNLSHAILHRANLQGTQLAMTNFTGAKLNGCRIYGMSAWDLILDDAVEQNELVILYRKENAAGEVDESRMLVDNLEAAQFVYLLLNNPKIRDAVNTITSRVVLILGRFTAERKQVLDEVRDELRRIGGFVSILFDFAQPSTRDITDTVTLLAQMSLFVLVDLTDPSSSPYELRSVYDATKVPIQSIVLDGYAPFTMFWDLRAANPERVLAPFAYRDIDDLKRSLSEKVIEPSVAAGEKLREQRNRMEQQRALWKKSGAADTLR